MRNVAILMLLPVLLMTGCAYHKTPVRPPEGLIFTEYRAPLSIDFEGNETRTNAPKMGTARSRAILGFAWDQCDIKTAAANGGINTIYYADYEVLKVFWLYGEFTVRVFGE